MCSVIPYISHEYLLGVATANVEREDILRQTAQNKSLHEISNDNGIKGKR
jgi:hypothetical protein